MAARQNPFSWRPKTNHAASSSRLKPPIEEYGFVSKGDESLLNFQTQEKCQKQIVKKYLEFCGASGGPGQLESEFAKLAVTPLNNPHAVTVNPAISQAQRDSPKNATYANARNAEISSILLSMRKLREGIVASGRIDKFAVDVYKFQIRAAILMQQVDTYHPALLHLLYTMHPVTPLSSLERQEFGAYHMLHLAGYREDYGQALAAKREFRVADKRSLQALDSMIHGNYWSYRAARNRVDQYLGRLMDYAEHRMRRAMLKCIGAAYFTVELAYIEIVAGMSWKRLQEEYQVGWELNEDTNVVTIRRPRSKQAPPKPTPPTKESVPVWMD